MRSLLPLRALGFGGRRVGPIARVGRDPQGRDRRALHRDLPDGRQIAAACRDQKIRLFTAPGGVLAQTLDPGDMRVSSLAYSRDGRRLAAGGPEPRRCSTRRPASAWPRSPASASASMPSPSPPTAKRSHSRPASLPRSCGRSRRRSVSPLSATRFSGSTALAFSPDGKLVVSSNADTTVRAFAAATGAPAWTFDELDLEPFALDFSPDSKTLVVAGADKLAVALDAATGKATHRLPRQPDPDRSRDASSATAAPSSPPASTPTRWPRPAPSSPGTCRPAS